MGNWIWNRCFLAMHAGSHGSPERAAAGLEHAGTQVEQRHGSSGQRPAGGLSRDKDDFFRAIYRQLDTIRKMFHIQDCEYVHFLMRHGRPCRWNAVSVFTRTSTNRHGKTPGWKRWSARTPPILIMTGM